jgi:very-short-patch-repair endonuclease
MGGLPDPDWYLDHVLVHAEPGRGGSFPLGPAIRWRAWWEQRPSSGGPLIELARRQGFVVTTAQTREQGWGGHDLRREVRRGRWSVPARGAASPVVVESDSALDQRRRHALTASAAILLRRGHVVSGRSAAILHGLPTIAVPTIPELTGCVGWLGRRDRAHLRGATLSENDVTRWFGADVTTVPRTIVDLARHDRQDGLMAADAALREGLTDAAAIQRALCVAAGWPGVRRARSVLALASRLAESPLESIVRLALHDSGFPPPELQLEIRGYRVDFVWPEQRLIVEADGLMKYSEAEWRREKRRESRLRALGYRIERVLWEDVMQFWSATRDRLWAAYLGR